MPSDVVRRGPRAVQERRQTSALRRPRRPGRYLATVGAGISALIAAPYVEELWPCARRRRLGQ